MKSPVQCHDTRKYLVILAALSGLGTVALCAKNAAAADTPVTGDCASSPESCDLQQRSTILRTILWTSASTSGACSSESWNGLPKERYPKASSNGAAVLASGVRGPVSFLNGVCEFHRKSAGVSSGDAARGIAELQAAQQGRLMPAQRQVAGLLEGLLHCRRLDDTLQRYGGDWRKLEQSATAKGEFCAHRAQAKASFGNMNWVGFELGYDTKDWSIYKHVEDVSSCAQRYLNSSYDASCQIGMQVSVDEAQVVGQRVAEQVLGELLGGSPTPAPGSASVAEGPITAAKVSDLFGAPSGAGAATPVVPPITAIMARKLATAREAVQGASGRFESLGRTAVTLDASVDALNRAVTPIGAGATAAAQTYEDAVRMAQEVVRMVDYWVKGYFQDEQGKDVRDTLAMSRSVLGDARRAVVAAPGSEGLMARLDLVLANLRALSGSVDREAQLVRRACAAYFCEIEGRTREAGLTDNACGARDAVTGNTYATANDLCVDAGRTAARALCSEVGFRAFTTTDADACMKAAIAP